MSTGAIVFFSTIVIVVIWAVAIYNQLVALKNRFKNGFAQIEVQLKRRYDLIPNLVETAKGYLAHERETLEAVIAARNDAATALQAASLSSAQALSRIMSCACDMSSRGRSPLSCAKIDSHIDFAPAAMGCATVVSWGLIS